ncbi:MAG: glycosyltransferase [Geminicoccaceae bacterium]
MPETVVHVVQHLRPGGLETLALDLQAHAPAGSTAHVVSLDGGAEETLSAWPRLVAYGDRLHFLDKKPGLSPRAVWNLAGLFRRLGATGVVTHHIGPLVYGGLAARLARVPGVVHVEHDAWHLADEAERRLQRRVLRIVRPEIIAVSPTVAGAMSRALPGCRPHVVPNGIDTARFVPGDKDAARLALGLPVGVPLIGCAARLEAVKGHEVLLGALGRMPSRIHLALAGVGSRDAELKALAASLDIAARVHFLGRVDDMPAFYRAVDLFCLSSHDEGFPLSPLEAQACDVPAVVTDVGGCREAVCPATGRVVPAGDPAALALALGLLIERRPPEEPSRFVRQRFDIQRTVAAYHALLAA